MAMLPVFICVDHAGDYGVGQTADEAKAAYEENIQPLADADGFRIVSLECEIPLPAQLDIAVDVPEVDGEPTVSVS